MSEKREEGVREEDCIERRNWAYSNPKSYILILFFSSIPSLFNLFFS